MNKAKNNLLINIIVGWLYLAIIYTIMYVLLFSLLTWDGGVERCTWSEMLDSNCKHTFENLIIDVLVIVSAWLIHSKTKKWFYKKMNDYVGNR